MLIVGWASAFCVLCLVYVFLYVFITKQLLFVTPVLTIARSQLLIGFQDTGKRTQLSCLGVPAWLTFILSSE